MSVQVTVAGLTIDPNNNSPIIILKDEAGEKTLPIWIGLLEATAIASELENIKFSRPMTHDLLRNVIKSFGGSVEKVEVVDLKDNTFFALIYTLANGQPIAIDARPSDAIALALRMKCPIFVQEKVFESAGRIEEKGQEVVQTEEGRKWTEILESLSPEHFGKYKM
jgi:hypothetical protein